MQPRMIPTLAAALLALTACDDSTRSAEIDIDPPSEATLAPCAGPRALPSDGLTQAQVEYHWSRDRRALVACRARHADLAAWASALTEILN